MDIIEAHGCCIYNDRNDSSVNILAENVPDYAVIKPFPMLISAEHEFFLLMIIKMPTIINNTIYTISES